VQGKDCDLLPAFRYCLIFNSVPLIKKIYKSKEHNCHVTQATGVGERDEVESGVVCWRGSLPRRDVVRIMCPHTSACLLFHSLTHLPSPRHRCEAGTLSEQRPESQRYVPRAWDQPVLTCASHGCHTHSEEC
jgi:hypothetical protein